MDDGAIHENIGASGAAKTDLTPDPRRPLRHATSTSRSMAIGGGNRTFHCPQPGGGRDKHAEQNDDRGARNF
jgi:hypothetical protein